MAAKRDLFGEELARSRAGGRDDGKLDQSNVVKKSSTSSESYIILNSLGSGGKLEPYVSGAG